LADPNALVRRVEGRLPRTASVHFAERAAYPGPAPEAADHFMVSLGYRSLDKHWFLLDWMKLRVELASRLQKSLAYGVRLLSPDQAAELTLQFADLFDPNSVVFLTNWIDHGWNSVTESTFDAAYVGIDDHRLALFLFEDED
jgi:hypothetical protein